MKLLLCAVNAKYIHSSLAIRSLAAYAGKAAAVSGWEIKLREYTINNRAEEILQDIYREKADVAAFSCYIWNMDVVIPVCEDLKLAFPGIEIWLGGPEVSYDSCLILKKHPEISLVMRGEGEETFRKLILGMKKEDVPGITWRKGQGAGGEEKILENVPAPLLPMDSLPFVYDASMAGLEHKILYYETGRGCPFSCSYCLSSVDKTVRFRSLPLVKEELRFFMERRVRQVKLVDRTFNCDRKRAREIWEYILENDNGITNFHFEISADLLCEEDIRLFGKMRPGLIQLEIGVQSVHPPTIEAICRKTDLGRLQKRVLEVRALGTVHQHLDLIAGLPWEGLSEFISSFNWVYALGPDNLQLGFLKVLKGSPMEKMAGEYGLVRQKRPVYEVISTKWLSYGDILFLKQVEEMVEVYYNSGQFRLSLSYLLHFSEHAFAFYGELGEYYRRCGLFGKGHNRAEKYGILRAFAQERKMGDREVLTKLLTIDLYLRENVKSRPGWAPDAAKWKNAYREFYRVRGAAYLGAKDYDPKKAARQCHIEFCGFDPEETAAQGEKSGMPCHILFDYGKKNPITKEAAMIKVEV